MRTVEEQAARMLDILLSCNSNEEAMQHLRNALQLAYEDGMRAGVQHFGELCATHFSVAAWLAPPVNEESQPHCFGCFVDNLEVATRRQMIEGLINLGKLPPDALENFNKAIANK